MFYYEEEISPEQEKWIDMQHECREFMMEIVDHLYSNETLDVSKFESQLEEICHILKITLPAKALQIQRKNTQTPAYIDTWLEFNNSYLKQIAI